MDPYSRNCSPASAQSKGTFGQPNSESHTSLSGTMRWSDMVPPDSALTFAVVWDGDDELVGFSGAEWLRSSKLMDRTKSIDSPLDVTDGQSQVLTVLARASTDPGVTSNFLVPPSGSAFEPHSATLAFFRENHSFLFSEYTPLPFEPLEPSESKPRPAGARTQTSSTLEGMDVYLRGSMLGKAHRNNRQFSCFQALDDGFTFDPRTSFAHRFAHVYSQDAERRKSVGSDVTDEGFAEAPFHRPDIHAHELGGNDPSFPILPSKKGRDIPPSIKTTTETADEHWRWSSIEKPMESEYPTPLRFATQGKAQRRRLRKARPPDSSSSDDIRSIPASASKVLGRNYYNYERPDVNESDGDATQNHLNEAATSNFFAAPSELQSLAAVRQRMEQPCSPLPFPGIPLASSASLPKLVRNLSKTCKSIKTCKGIKNQVHSEKDGWVYVDVKTQIKQHSV